MAKSRFLPGSPNDMINHYFPEKTARMHCDDKFFMTVKIKGLLKKRDNAYKHKRMSGFKELRKEYHGKSGRQRRRIISNISGGIIEMVMLEHGGRKS